MKSLQFFAALGLSAAICLTGCVSKKKYAALQSEYDTLAAKYHDSQVSLAESRTGSQGLEALLKEARENNEDLKKRYAALQGNLEQSLNQNAQGNVNIAKLVDEINASNRYIKQLVEAKSKSDSLNMVLTNNLTRSLSRDDLRDVDIKVLKGVVYISLADNMLFESGSYEISPRAMEILGKIAKIIRITAATTYLWKATPTMCLFRVPTSATTGICRRSAHHLLCRCSRIVSELTPRA